MPGLRAALAGQSGEFARRSVQEQHTRLHSHRREWSTLEEEPGRLRTSASSRPIESVILAEGQAAEGKPR